MMETAMEALASIATFIFFASLKSTALLVLVLLAQKAFSRHLSANGRYLLWLTVAISLVTPLGFEVRIPEMPVSMASTETIREPIPSASEASRVAPVDVQVFTPAPEPYPYEPTLRREFALPLLWLAGVLAVFALMALASYRFAALVRQASPPPEALQTLLRQCEQQAGCRSNIRLLASSGLRAPVVAGLFQPVLLWPAGLETLLTPAQVQHVLMHEVTHVKRRDIFSACIVAVLQALHWFNPAIWIAFSWLRQDREMACDSATVRTLRDVDAHDYAHTLIQLGALRPGTVRVAPGLGILDSHAQLRRRIHMLAQVADPSARHFLTSALLLAFSTLAFSQPATAPRAEEAMVALPVEQPEAPRPLPLAAAIESFVEQESVAAAALLAEVQAPPSSRAAAENSLLPQVAMAQVPTEPVQEPAFTPPNDTIVVASADTPAAVPAFTPERVVAANETEVVAAPAAAPAGQSDTLICRRQEAPGSRVRTRRCLTEAQWAAAEGLAPRSHAFTRGLYPTDMDGAFNNLRPEPQWRNDRNRSTYPDEASAVESAPLVCRSFASRETGDWRACDSESAWETFAQNWGIAMASLPEVESFAPRGGAPGLQDEVCRNRSRVASLIKDRVCSSAAQWAAIDMAETGACWPDNHSGTFREICFELSAQNQRRSWNAIAPTLTPPVN